MIVRLLEDLRFVIGFFFSIVGMILIVMGFVEPPASSETMNLNLMTGLVMVVFSLVMFALTYFGENPEDYKPEQHHP